MSVKKIAIAGGTLRTYKTQLEYLYARRSAVNALIQSLEKYDRCRAKRLDPPQRRSA